VSWLYTAPLALIAPLIVLLILGALEIGHRLGRLKPITAQQVSTISGPILAIVGLLLAFSFAMAGDRFAARRAAGVQEANAIGTFWLRTSFMPEPTGTEMRARVHRYVEIHLEHLAARVDAEKLAHAEAEAIRLQNELWALLDRDARQAPEANRLLLVAPALNDMIDGAANALAARENRLPDALVAFVVLLVLVAGVVLGYRPRDETRNLVTWGLFVVVVGGVMLVLLDMDRPRRGLITTDNTPYVRLRDSLNDFAAEK
jgi:hypothetical protein